MTTYADPVAALGEAILLRAEDAALVLHRLAEQGYVLVNAANLAEALRRKMLPGSSEKPYEGPFGSWDIQEGTGSLSAEDAAADILAALQDKAVSRG